ncbi:MAG: glycosyltransferase family 2 protein [candidate division Zixibacteria bacterium]|nr:glycosyltransferase family 2 protein [candidate division Zixibacteria bacterium]
MGIEVSVLIVHYYAEEWLSELFGSMAGFFSTHVSEILVWDNGSQNGQPGNLVVPCPLTWLSSSNNIGFAGGHNALSQWAKGKRFLIINPDAEFVTGGLERLWKTAEEDPGAGVVVPRIQYPDGRQQVSVFPPYTFGFDFRKSFWLEHRTMFSRAQRELDKDLTEAKEPFPVGWASGACMLVSREAWEKTGGFDPNFFFGGEDADFCQRARKAGFEILCEPRALLIHQAGQSLEREPRNKVLYYYQKRLYYARKHFTQIQYGILWLISVFELVGKWAIGLFLSLFRKRWKEKRKGYAGALALIFSGRWRNLEGLLQNQAVEKGRVEEVAV